ncbi:MAG: response regulator [Acidobacteriaceae bacterium]|jgi:CheY-like chemotaxis protein
MANLDANSDSQLARPATQPKVLLVDDDEAVLDTLTQVLRLSGFEVCSANNVNQALRCIACRPFDALITDLHMPQPGDGLTVVSAMRHANPEAVTLICSAFPEMQQATTAILHQADEILVKPLRPDHLVKIIQERLRLGVNTAAPPPVESVADILERSTQSTIEEWLQSVRDEPEVISVPLDDDARCAHLPQLFRELVYRLRFPVKLGTRAPVSPAAAQHGVIRRQQGYSAAMLVEESRMLQVSVFRTLQDNLKRIDFSVLLVGVMAIADEVDSQLAQQMASYITESSNEVESIDARSGPVRPHRHVA